MPFLSKVSNFWKNLFRRRELERDLNDELQAYVDEMAERRIQAGVEPDTAREAVLRELGGIDRVKDLVRQQRIGIGNLRKVIPVVVVALVAFVSGAGTAVGVMRRRTKAPAESARTEVPGKYASSSLPARVLEGRVVDSVTGRPIANVEVGLRASPPSRRYTYTDEMGHFVFSDPPNQPYGLESGTHLWTINLAGSGMVSPLSTSNDFFEFVVPSAVSVKSKEGQPQDGESIAFRGIGKNGKPYPPAGQEFRRFRYSTSVVELRAEDRTSGKVAAR